MKEFQVGDNVWVKKVGHKDYGKSPNHPGMYLCIRSITNHIENGESHRIYWFHGKDAGEWDFNIEGYESEENNKNNTMSTIKELWKSFKRSEPEATYVEAGILDGNEEFTQDGKDLFTRWLLDKNPEFKTEVADKLVAEKNKEKK